MLKHWGSAARPWSVLLRDSGGARSSTGQPKLLGLASPGLGSFLSPVLSRPSRALLALPVAKLPAVLPRSLTVAVPLRSWLIRTRLNKIE